MPVFVVVLMAVINLGPSSELFFPVFSLLIIDQFFNNSVRLRTLIQLFVFIFTITSIYGLLITYSPLTGLSPSFINYAAFFGDPTVLANSFGFYHRDFTTVPASFALILSVSMAKENTRMRSVFISCSVILLAQMINVVLVTGGSGRTGFVLLLFAIIFVLFMRINMNDVLPILILSPLILLTIIQIYVSIYSPNKYLLILDDFTSGRLSLYTDSIRVITNLRGIDALFGLGTAPWGEFTLEQLEVGSQSENFYFKETLTRPHNFIFSVFITSGVFTGGIILYWCAELARAGKTLISECSAFDVGVGIVLLGSVFVGTSVGKMGPFSTLTNDMIFWWICFAYFILIYTEINN
jgi:hypothetical protein